MGFKTLKPKIKLIDMGRIMETELRNLLVLSRLKDTNPRDQTVWSRIQTLKEQARNTTEKIHKKLKSRIRMTKKAEVLLACHFIVCFSPNEGERTRHSINLVKNNYRTLAKILSDPKTNRNRVPEADRERHGLSNLNFRKK